MRIQIISAVLVFCVPGVAHAQEPPNLVGVWKGSSLAVGSGATPYRVLEGPGPVFFDQRMEFTYTITEQKDSRFIGKMNSGKVSENVMGSFQPPAYSGGVILDDDGRYSFTMRDPSTMDLCYEHLYPKSKVVACFTLKKE